MKVPSPSGDLNSGMPSAPAITFMCGGASAAGRVKVYFKSPIAVRRSEFRYAKRARQTFMCGGAAAAGRMKVYFE